ncbi:MAG TPA: bifunctional glycosyltransferase/class I SAM-dependent methyltransferase, partial [Mycobacteriales bacterium]|nr:bifunctional glycosyltransferase/class I SAM-dependent methyltransferase [Mycobacteriales bacterium]
IGILVVAYNAESTLAATLDRIPVDFRPRIDEILVFDDASADDTVGVATQWRQANDGPPTTIVRHLRNLGYGGNQKAGYRAAIERGLDIVVLLHGDGQYAPECLPEMVAPLERGECDAVFGSRMMLAGAARRGGMPLYKWVGNKVLTGVENALLHSRLTEFHSGYRAYAVPALADVPFENNTDDFDFDTQIIVQFLHGGKRIVEIPIPTYYGDEICYVNGVRYARDVVRDVVQYRLTRMGFWTDAWVPADDEYGLKEDEGTSHTVIVGMLADRSPQRILDLGCSGGRLAERLRKLGHTVTGVDSSEVPGVRDRVDRFVRGDLEAGIPAEAGAGYDVVIAADVIEHVTRPEALLRQMAGTVAPDGEILVSTPNFAHWYPRVRVATGTFGYDRRGILDETHLRFFTRRSLLRLVKACGLEVRGLSYTGLPFDVLAEGNTGTVPRAARRVDRALVRFRPTLFGYQFVLRLRPHHGGSVIHERDAPAAAQEVAGPTR